MNELDQLTAEKIMGFRLMTRAEMHKEEIVEGECYWNHVLERYYERAAEYGWDAVTHPDQDDYYQGLVWVKDGRDKYEADGWDPEGNVNWEPSWDSRQTLLLIDKMLELGYIIKVHWTHPKGFRVIVEDTNRKKRAVDRIYGNSAFGEVVCKASLDAVSSVPTARKP